MGFGLPARLERELSRELATVQARGELLAAREAAKVEAIAEVAEHALMATSHISSLEAMLVARTPHAEGRLRHVADAACASMANVVLGTGRRV
jgi:hypothetical protein